MKVTYQVSDGYAGGSRPQTVRIDLDELSDCTSVDEAMSRIEEIVQDDFEMRISWSFIDAESVREKVQEHLEK